MDVVSLTAVRREKQLGEGRRSIVGLVFFLVVVEGCFCWGFSENRVLNVVFLWLFCGEMRGKDGRLTVTFSLIETTPRFSILFFGAGGLLSRGDSSSASCVRYRHSEW